MPDFDSRCAYGLLSVSRATRPCLTCSRLSCTITDFVLPYPDIIVIIRRYYEQLEEEREYRHEFRLNPTVGGTYEAKEGLLTQGPYAYTDNHNAFGSHNHA